MECSLTPDPLAHWTRARGSLVLWVPHGLLAGEGELGFVVLRIIMGEPAGFNSPRPPRGSGAGGEGILIHLIPESSWFATLPSLRRRETQGVFIPLHPRIFARWSIGVLLFPHPLQGSRLFEVDPLTPRPPLPLNAGEGELGFVGAAWVACG